MLKIMFFSMPIFVVILCAKYSSGLDGQFGIPNNNSMPVLLKKGEFPFVVSLVMKDYLFEKHVCSAIIIDKSFVLTAAECILKDLMERSLSFSVRGGCVKVNDKDCFERQIISFYIHEQFGSNNYDNDLAIAKLKKPLSKNKEGKSVKLSKHEKPAVSSRCLIISWLVLPDHRIPIALFKTPVTIVDHSVCEKHHWPKYNKESMICGETFVTDDEKVCDQSYGGALVCNDSVRGMTRSPERCGGDASTNAFIIDLSYYNDWIHDALKNYNEMGRADNESWHVNSSDGEKSGAKTADTTSFFSTGNPVLLVTFTTILSCDWNIFRR